MQNQMEAIFPKNIERRVIDDSYSYNINVYVIAPSIKYFFDEPKKSVQLHK
jgi:hypothetical protein